MTIVPMFSIEFSIGQSTCKPDFIAFSNRESLTYKIQYHLGFVWLTAGEVVFSVDKIKLYNDSCYHFKGVGRTYDGYDWIYKVRDTYESWSHPESLKPYEFKRDVYEGGYETENHYCFNYKDSLIYANGLRKKKEILKDTLILNDCLFDVMSLVYYSRCIDYKKYNIGELIPLSIILDNQRHAINLKCLGKEIIEHNDIEISTLKFSSEMIEGSIFNKGDEMIIWVTNDKKRVPIKVKAEILVGSVEAILIE